MRAHLIVYKAVKDICGLSPVPQTSPAGRYPGDIQPSVQCTDIWCWNGGGGWGGGSGWGGDGWSALGGGYRPEYEEALFWDFAWYPDYTLHAAQVQPDARCLIHCQEQCEDAWNVIGITGCGAATYFFGPYAGGACLLGAYWAQTRCKRTTCVVHCSY